MITLTNWKYITNDTVLLSYSDGDAFLIRGEDFNRAFGPICSGDKNIIKSTYAIQ